MFRALGLGLRAQDTSKRFALRVCGVPWSGAVFFRIRIRALFGL